MTLYAVQAVIVLDYDGRRLLAKYYSAAPYNTMEQQYKLEETLLKKAKHLSTCGRSKATLTRRDIVNSAVSEDILLIDRSLVICKCVGDALFFLLGPEEENELFLHSILTTFYDAVMLLLS